MQVIVLHGPNLSLLGRREPHIYGTTTLADIDQKLRTLAGSLNVDLDCYQSNHEGDLIDKLHEYIDRAAGALVNPAGLTQHGVPLHDAAREEWRRHSIISPAVKGTIQGLGWRSYTAALQALIEMVRETTA